MERLVITRPNRPGRIERLPTHGELRPFGGFMKIAKVLIAFSQVELQTVKEREVPHRARHRDTDFAVDRPCISISSGSLQVGRADRAKRRVQRVRVILVSLGFMFRAQGKANGPGRKAEEIASHLEIFEHFSSDRRIMQCDKDTRDSGRRILAPRKGVKCGGWVCIGQRFAQAGFAYRVAENRRFGHLVIAEPSLPAPGLKVVAEFTHFAPETEVPGVVV